MGQPSQLMSLPGMAARVIAGKSKNESAAKRSLPDCTHGKRPALTHRIALLFCIGNRSACLALRPLMDQLFWGIGYAHVHRGDNEDRRDCPYQPGKILSSIGWCSVGLRDRRQMRTPPFERSSTAIAALALGRHRYELKQRKAVRLQFVQDGHASDEQNQKLQ